MRARLWVLGLTLVLAASGFAGAASQGPPEVWLVAPVQVRFTPEAEAVLSRTLPSDSSWSPAEMHIHTKASDGKSSPTDIATLYRSAGYRIAYVTDQTGFVDYLYQAGVATVTTQSALTWATMPLNAQPVSWKKRLSVVRGFSRYLEGAEYAPYLRFEFRNVRLDHGPDQVQVDSTVVVYQLVPHPPDTLPGNLRMVLLELIRKAAGCLTHDLDPTDHGILYHAILQEAGQV